MPRPAGIAFAGFRHAHIYDLYILAQKDSRVRITGCWEGNDAARAQAAEKVGADFRYVDYEALLDDPDVDLVAIGDTFGARGGLIIRALDKGKHVIADKPICTSLDELDRIETLLNERNLQLGCMLTLRDSATTPVVYELIRSGQLGEIHTITFHGQHPLNYGSRPAWYYEEGQHGGTINDLGIHGVDLIRYLTGRELEAVEAARCWNAFAVKEPHFEDCAQFMYRLDGGCGILADVSYATPNSCGFGLPFYWRFTIAGSRGIVEFNLYQLWVALADQDQALREVPCPPVKDLQLDDFLRVIAGEEPVRGRTSEEILRSSRATLEIQKAADRSRSQPLPR